MRRTECVLSREEECELLRYVFRTIARQRVIFCKQAVRTWVVWCVKMKAAEHTIRKARMRRVFNALHDFFDTHHGDVATYFRQHDPDIMRLRRCFHAFAHQRNIQWRLRTSLFRFSMMQ